jgi:hypothetical protein
MVFLLGNCAKHPIMVEPINKIPVTRAKQVRPLSTFSQVDIQGKINVSLHTGYKQPLVILQGDPRDLTQVSVLVKDNTLYMALGSGLPKFGSIVAEVRAPSLARIRYIGSGYLTGTRLNSRQLDVVLSNPGVTNLGGNISLRSLKVIGDGSVRISGISSPYLRLCLKGSPKVQLSGVAGMASLNMDGAGWLSFYWVKSETLIIRARKAAKIQLAGAVHKLDVELWGSAQFRGRYLRAQRSFVKTHDHSMAEISTAKHQSNLATDASDIYYFNLPNTRADFMGFDGSVLDMREWDQPELRNFDRYNKQFP